MAKADKPPQTTGPASPKAPLSLRVGSVMDIQGEVVNVDYSLDLSDIVLSGGHKPFTAPVAVKGKVENTAGITTLSYIAYLSMDLRCDRCLAIFHKEEQPDFHHVLVRRLAGEDNDEFLVLPEGLLDVTETVVSDILLWLPFRHLCKEDCKGLCSHCGCDLNETTCDCAHLD